MFQGAKSAPTVPTLSSIVPKLKPRVNIPVRELLGRVDEASRFQQQIAVAKPLAPGPTFTEWIPGQIIVRFNEKIDAKKALGLVRATNLNLTHGGFVSEYLHVLKATKRDRSILSVGETQELAKKWGALPGVRFTEVDQWQHIFAVPNDKLYSAQWHYPAMNLPAAWDITQGSATVIVADIDTGIVVHPELDSRILQGIDMISDPARAGDGDGRDDDPKDQGGDQPNGGSSWHGSHTAGTIGAATNNMTGVSGVDWNAKIVPVRVLGIRGGSVSDIAAGMNWATGGTVPGSRNNPNPAKVVNMSLGGVSEASQVYQEIIDAANNVGAIFVVAAGNSNEDAFKTIPCIQQNLLCIGATRFSGKRASYSNFGPAVTLMAPGGETAEDSNGDGYPDGVLSTVLDAQNQPTVAFSQGTSMATPHVTGVVALMKAVNPNLNFTTAKMHLTATANPAQKCNEGCGAGLVNAQAAVLAAKGTPPTGPAKLNVTASELFFSAGAATVTLGISNLGAATLNVQAGVTGTAAGNLSFPKGNTLTIQGGQTGSLDVTASFTGLADGTHPAVISLNSNGGDATVNAKVRVGGATGKGASVGLVFKNSAGDWKVAAEVTATAASGYAYSMDVAPGKYFVIGLIDENGNAMFEDVEPVGLFPTTDSPEEVDVTAGSNHVNVDFALVPSKPVNDAPAAAIGGPCTSACPDNGTCVTAWPGGYCSKDCATTSCPLGSSCLNTGTTAFCLSQCTGAGTGQSNCRASYVCYNDGTGIGVCLPKCLSDTDCGTGSTCDTASGYCL